MVSNFLFDIFFLPNKTKFKIFLRTVNFFKLSIPEIVLVQRYNVICLANQARDIKQILVTAGSKRCLDLTTAADKIEPHRVFHGKLAKAR
jgi:hypothetical protein